MVEETHTVVTPDGDMGVVVRRPDGDGPFPIVVFFHHGPGLDDGSKKAMERIADGGFYVASHDRYYREGEYLTFDIAKLRAAGPDSDEMKAMYRILLGTTDEMVASDLNALLGELEGDPMARSAPMGCIGYCIGARTVLRSLADHPEVFAAGVALHPSFCVTNDADSPHEAVPSMTCSLFVGIGGADQMSSPEANKPLIDAVVELGDRGIVEIFDGADHGFAVPGLAYHEDAADRSYERALDLFRKTLGTPQGAQR
jgi:carboxymethylenebutenolidase